MNVDVRPGDIVVIHGQIVDFPVHVIEVTDEFVRTKVDLDSSLDHDIPLDDFQAVFVRKMNPAERLGMDTL